MDVLFTGNLSLISKALFDRVGKEHRCVVFCEKDKIDIKGKNIVSYSRKVTEEDFARVFTAFNFETVLYFSQALDGAKKVFDELEMLEQALYQCRKNKVEHFIYVTGNTLLDCEMTDEQKSSYFILKDACEALCKSFAQNYGIHVQILQVPYLYQMEGKDCQLSRWCTEALEAGKIQFPEPKTFCTDFLCDEDLGELLGRMLDEPNEEEFSIINLSGKNDCTFEELGEIFRATNPELLVEYKGQSDCVPRYIDEGYARREYGWYPEHVIKNDIKDLLTVMCIEKRQHRVLGRRRIQHQKIQEKIRVMLEVLLSFFIAELLNRCTRNNIMVNFIDFRLVYVVMMGLINGLYAGVFSALLSCAGYVVEKGAYMQWQVIFYNVQNWLPFACYFLLGSVSGYTTDKHEDEVQYSKEEYDILEDKYVFLNSLYANVLERKESFNNQIIGYKDSFGKMYSVVKKLDRTLPEQVNYEAVNVLEEVLSNQYVAIYSIDSKSDFARLSVCSRNCNSELGKSLKITDYPLLLKSLKENATFINRDALEGYPAYATPVFRGKELVGMILLTHADYTQMNMEFSNKFRIMSDLIRDSLIRAREYDERNETTLEDTRILAADKFREILSVKQQMRQKQYLDYILLKVRREGQNLKELSDRIVGMVRNNDVLGLKEDGELYLLLSQTRRKDFDIVEQRMRKRQISFELVEE